MNVTDPIADMLTRIRNGLLAGKTVVRVPGSNLKRAIAHLLKEEGFVDEVSFVEDERQGHLYLTLRYWKDQPVIAGIRRVSKPGRRRYVKAAEIPRVLGGLGICIMSTSKGVMTGHDAVKNNVGGEVLCEVW
jgi:small subunit ribosomal protein S8